MIVSYLEALVPKDAPARAGDEYDRRVRDVRLEKACCLTAATLFKEDRLRVQGDNDRSPLPVLHFEWFDDEAETCHEFYQVKFCPFCGQKVEALARGRVRVTFVDTVKERRVVETEERWEVVT